MDELQLEPTMDEGTAGEALDDNISYGNLTYLYDDNNNAYLQFYYILWTFVVPMIFGIIVVVGTVGNTLVIYVILSRTAMQTVTNFLLINLAFSDIAFLIICVPLTAYKYAAATWPFGDRMCKIISYVIYVTAYVTVYTLVAISVLRYVTVIHSSNTAKYRTKKNMVIINILIWVVILGVNVPAMLTHQLKVWDEHFAYCGLVDGSVKPFFLSFFIFGYAVPLVVICLLYVVVLCHLNKGRSSYIDQTRERTARASRVIILVVVIFLLSWLPQHVSQMLSAFSTVPQGPWYEVFRILSNSMAYGNSCANPIIYNFYAQDFKKGFREVVCCCSQKLNKRRRNDASDKSNGIKTERTAIV